MLVEKRRLGEILVRKGVITQTQLNEALQMQRLTPAPLGSILSHLGFVDEDGLVTMLADEYGVQAWNLKSQAPDPMAISKLPGDIAKTYRVLPVAMRGETLLLAMSNPEDIEAIDMVSYTTRMKIEPVLAARLRLLQMIDRFYGGKAAPEAESSLTANGKAEASAPKNEFASETEPVVQLVDQTIREGIRAGASDIHFEPTVDTFQIKYRINGFMVKQSGVMLTLQEGIISRLRHLAGLDHTESDEPQDGRMSVVVDERRYNLRLSIMPSQTGSRLVLRVVDGVTSVRALADLGFTRSALRLYEHLVRRPYGLVLITGPSGSGKTTTLYSTLVSMKDASRNVMTCEDPVEMDLKGVSQANVDPAAGLTYERQLGALMRQSPDVLAVGEIRNEPTSRAVMRASLTGHLVIATMQANDAPTAIARLADLGADPQIMANGITCVTSQRLLRRLCSKCVRTDPISDSDRQIFEVFGLSAPAKLPRAVGCPECLMTGYTGRVAIHEVLPMTTKLAELIVAGSPVSKLREEGASVGYVSLQLRALDLVTSCEITLEDAKRVVALDPDFKMFLRDD